MKPLFIFLTLLFAFATAFAQKDSLQILSHWKKTDIRSYKVVKINTQQTDSEQMHSDTETYKFRFVVMDSTKAGYRIKWDFDESPIYDELNEDEYEDLTNQFSGLELIYTTDRRGIFKEIENWKDISRYFTAYYNIKYDEEPKKDSTRVINAYKKMKEEISTREGVENIFFSEMRFFQLPFGNTLPVNDTVRYDGQMQVGPGDDYAASHIKYFFSDIDRQSGEAILNKITRVDRDDAKFKLESIMQKNIDTMPGRTAKEKEDKEQAQKEISNLKFDSGEDFSFRLNYKTGLPSVVYFKQSTDVDLKVTRSVTAMEVIIEEQK
jgi:hypothetical protein